MLVIVMIVVLLAFQPKNCAVEMVEAENEVSHDLMGGQLFIKEYPPKVATINTIKFHVGRLLI